jgi:hypothetical protein
MLSIPMSEIECNFLDQVKRKQHRFWLTLLVWVIAVVAFVGVVTSFTNASDALIQVVAERVRCDFPPAATAVEIAEAINEPLHRTSGHTLRCSLGG